MMVWFETILVVLTALSGLVWLLDKLVLAKRRALAAGPLEPAREPVLVDYSKAFFPILVLVLGLRSFIAEPFRIPSSSMMPTLLIGDFILVNKFAYGLRWPITNKKFLDIGEPVRGDVVVFRPPHHPREDWIKRVIGLPGDTISYHDNQVSINGKRLPYRVEHIYQGVGQGADATGATELTEGLPGRPHFVLEHPDVPFLPQGQAASSVARCALSDGLFSIAVATHASTSCWSGSDGLKSLGRPFSEATGVPVISTSAW